MALADLVPPAWVLTAAAAVLALHLLAVRPHGDVYAHFARIGGPSAFSVPYVAGGRPVHELVAEGYRRVTKPLGAPFVVRWWAKDYLLMPPRYLAELRGVDWHALSFFSNISDAFYLHTQVGDLYRHERMVDVVKRCINPHLPRLTGDALSDEVDWAIEREFGAGRTGTGKTGTGSDADADADGWSSAPAARTIINVAHRTATSVLVSAESARDERFVRESSAFVMSLFVTALATVKLPLGVFRGLLAYPISLPHRWRLARAVALLRPQVERRMAERGAPPGEPWTTTTTAPPPDDAIEWTLACSSPSQPGENTARRVCQELLYGLWAGSSAPGGLVTDLLFQTLLMPEYLAPLRAEAERALHAHGGRWADPVFGALRLLDSFIRETNRLYPTGSVTCSRTVQGRPFRFADGLTLPVGTRFGFPIKAMQTDPDLFDEPQHFDGFRFAKRDDRWAASTVDQTNLAFGYGNHACPGRFFAVREVKMIFVKLILAYDFKWKGEVRERPRPIFVEGQFIPNMSQEICYRKRVS